MDRGREFSRLIAIELVAEGKRQRVTQRAIAAAAGVGEAQMSLYTKGRRGAMTVAQIVGACDLLKILPETIVARAYAELPAEGVSDVDRGEDDSGPTPGEGTSRPSGPPILPAPAHGGRTIGRTGTRQSGRR